MTILSLSGLIGSGKDTVAEYLTEQCGYTKESFAGTLKDAVAAIFSWNREMLEGKTKEAREEREQVDTWWAKKLNMPHLTPRWVLQYFGTDVCRQHFSDKIWLSSLERKLMTFNDKNIVISDARFINELTMLKQTGAHLIRVKRGPNPDWWEYATNAYRDTTAVKRLESLGIHRSEWDWAGFQFDTVIMNDRSLDDLYVTTKNLASI